MKAHAGDTPFPPIFPRRCRARDINPIKLLGRYHRWILYGGATLFTVVILFAAAMVYAFDRHMLRDALQSEFFFILGIALVLSMILWAIVILFNRLIFFPVLSEALRVNDSEAFNRAMMAVAPLGFFVLNYRTGEIMLDNVQARAIANRCGAPGDAMRFPKRLMTSYRDQSRSNGAGRKLVHAVLELPAADGTAAYALAAFTRTRYLRNDVLLCCLSDITAQKSAERALLRAKLEADEANKAKSMFLALISHEIRTPLHGASGHLELLETAELPAAELELVHTIRNSFESLLRIINDILDISRIEAGQLALDNAPFSLRETVERCRRLWAPALDAKSIAFRCEVDPAVPDLLIGDAGRIEQILNNLLSNAVKFTSRGGVVLAISASPQATACGLRITVRDSGVGVAMRDQKRLFLPFSQANTGIAREFGGTGLGLSLCKQLIDAMQGEISIQSQYGSGTAILIELSLPLPSAHDNTRPAHSNAVSASASTGSAALIAEKPQPQAAALRLLAVEDDPVSRNLLKKQLFRLGYTNVHFADNGIEALDRATTLRYDLILTDLGLPHMSGDDLIRSLRRRGLTMPIIAITASMKNDQVKAILPELDLLLTKPVSLLKLQNALARYAPAEPPAAENAGQSMLLSDAVDPEMAGIFLKSYRGDLWGLLHAFRGGDSARLADGLHRIKGALLVMQEDDLARLAEQLWNEIDATSSLPAEIHLRQFVRSLLQAVRRIRAAMLAA